LEGVQIQRFHYFWPRSLELLADGAILENLRRRRWLFLQAPFLLLFEFVATYSLARASRPAVIHAHWFVPQGMVAALVGSLLGIPVVVTALGGDVSGLRGWLWSTIRKVVASKSKAITVVSTDLKNQLSGVVSAAGEPPAVMPMGVDTDRLRDGSDGAIPADKTILFVGRLAEKKGLQYLIRAFPQVLSRHPDARLLVVGDGPLRAEMEALARHLDLAGHVRFVGGQSPEELRRSYLSSRLFVVPSVVARSGDTEGLPVALLEAMAAGRPVVATSVGGIPEIVIPSRTGLLVEPGSPTALAAAVNELLDSPAKADRMGKVARRWVRRRFDWRRVAAGYASLLTQAASS
jgi:glycosyltransferase involved in cell wall biosynthesis